MVVRHEGMGWCDVEERLGWEGGKWWVSYCVRAAGADSDASNLIPRRAAVCSDAVAHPTACRRQRATATGGCCTPDPQVAVLLLPCHSAQSASFLQPVTRPCDLFAAAPPRDHLGSCVWQRHIVAKDERSGHEQLGYSCLQTSVQQCPIVTAPLTECTTRCCCISTFVLKCSMVEDESSAASQARTEQARSRDAAEMANQTGCLYARRLIVDNV